MRIAMWSPTPASFIEKIIVHGSLHILEIMTGLKVAQEEQLNAMS